MATSGLPGGFATTRWSLIASLHGGDPRASRAALEELCAAAWYPLYAYARRRGLAVEDARDATQGFFVDLLERGDLARADRERGRFRSFLLAAFQHFLAKRAAAEGAQKRGGGRTILSLDFARAEELYGIEPADEASPEGLYQAAWARGLLDRVVATLGAEYDARDKGELFRALEGELAGDSTPRSELARRLGTSEGAVKVAAHRLRSRYRELLRQAILDTLADPAELEDELSALFEAVGGRRAETP